jgi:transposase
LAARVQLREITNEEGNRLLRIVRRASGSVVMWRRAQIVLLSAQGMAPARISEVVFTDPDTVREVIHNVNRDGFETLYPRYRGGRPPTFTLPQRQEIKRIALSDPPDLGQAFSTWSLSKLADISSRQACKVADRNLSRQEWSQLIVGQSHETVRP